MRTTNLVRSIPLAWLLIAAAPPASKPAPAPAPTPKAAPATIPQAAHAAASPPAKLDDTLPQPLAVAIAAGPAHDTISRLLAKPYAEATGTELTQPAWDGSADGLRAIETAHGADLVLVNGAILAAQCNARQLAALDWQALGRDRFLPNTTSDCGAGALLSATVLAWDATKLPAMPDWADFWDVAKHPGRRALHRGARGNLEIALLADGVSAGDVYRTLRSTGGVDRAFRKLDQLKPYLLWWDQPAQPGQMLASAKVALTSAPSAGLPAGGRLHIGTQWAGALTEMSSWAIPAQAPHARAANIAILLATDPARLALLARATGLGPTIRTAIALLPGDIQAQTPAFPANQQGALAIDEGFWAENGEKLEARFSAWVGK